MLNFKKLESNNYINWIENSISDEYLNYYEYSDLENIQSVGGGNFGKVFRANWKNTDTVLALKSFNNNKLTLKEIVNEIKLHRKVDFHPNILRFYGITKTESEEVRQMNYLLVLEYADSGTLNNYLSMHFNVLGWYDNYQLAFQLASAVECIHESGIIHCDLHANNVLIHNNQIKLADFGLSRKIPEESNSNCNGVFGVVPYIDPKCFDNRNYKLNKKSDIYSIGVLMWQISSGHEPFHNEEYDIKLALNIINGRREKIVDGTPIKYCNLYKECWNFEENKRPEIQQVISTLKELIIFNNNEKEVYLTTEDETYLKSKEPSIISMISLNMNNDLIIENISNIINSRSNINNSTLNDQDYLLSESIKNEDKAQTQYDHSNETKVNDELTQHNTDDLYKNCENTENTENEFKESFYLSNKEALNPFKKLADNEYLKTKYNLEFYIYIIALLYEMFRNEYNKIRLSGFQKFEEDKDQRVQKVLC
ncbi:hypothetical protein RclHR1_00580013 [Rhizophagus clarus]|uniref:Kinase-like domain-containing protein n=1 Tax=Rhizophagus clarus TaxID=94130 RepID=A0A2Z6RNQ2_9GLOM|nr:hypothetical protein RclHR1_00580013 [Rhizophagus clarus]GES92201.1 kinase-like domain-containing protein [Rhizophagus clarus]